ncbi:MAG: TerB family tellurite resistance protein [Candidatus Kuenenia sp.]|nr:TerB family tellurite resistance protein [Candidatus Kuenenia hertensis]
MGIFDKLSGSKDIQLTSKGALALAAMTMIGIDGSIEEDELATLGRIERGDRNAFDQAFKVYKDKSISDCVQIVGETLDQNQKVTVIANLLDIAMADGMLAGAEKELLESYVDSFQISEGVIKDIIDVIALKNDFSVF